MKNETLILRVQNNLLTFTKIGQDMRMKWQPEKLTRSQMADRRAEGVRLLEAGEMTQVQIARYLGVSEAAVSKWKKKLTEKGPQALEMQTATGRPPKLDQEAQQHLVEKLKQGALAAGFPTEQWTQARVKKVIQQEFGVCYHQNYISRLLKRTGLERTKTRSSCIGAGRRIDPGLVTTGLAKDKKRHSSSAQRSFLRMNLGFPTWSQ